MIFSRNELDLHIATLDDLAGTSLNQLSVVEFSLLIEIFVQLSLICISVIFENLDPDIRFPDLISFMDDLMLCDL